MLVSFPCRFVVLFPTLLISVGARVVVVVDSFRGVSVLPVVLLGVSVPLGASSSSCGDNVPVSVGFSDSLKAM